VRKDFAAKSFLFVAAAAYTVSMWVAYCSHR